jgi:hypothetical protein
LPKSRERGEIKYPGISAERLFSGLFFRAVATKRLPVRSARRGGSQSGLAPMRAAWPGGCRRVTRLVRLKAVGLPGSIRGPSGETRLGGPCASREKPSSDRGRPPGLKSPLFRAGGFQLWISNRPRNRIIAEKCLILLVIPAGVEPAFPTPPAVRRKGSRPSGACSNRCQARLPGSCAQPAAAIGTQAAPLAGMRKSLPSVRRDAVEALC